MNTLAEANIAYGALTAEFYLANFTFERAMARTLALLKDGGWAKVGDGFDDVNDFVRSLRLNQFRVAAELRQEFVERVKELQPKVSNRAMAEALGVGKGTIDRDVRGPYRPPDARDTEQNDETGGPCGPPDPDDGKHTVHVANNSGENEWYTPPDFIARARTVMGGIDCDPASSAFANGTVQAKTFYTASDDGLTKVWRGRVWLNPPYAQPLIQKFLLGFLARFECGDVTEGILLVNNATKTAAMQKALRACSALCFPEGRIKFVNRDGEATGAPLQGQMLFYFGANTGRFREVFSAKGAVLAP